MRIQNKHDVDLVFGISRGIPLTYVQRQVDNLFLTNLKKDKHIILFSCSKQGKTSLINKHLKKGDYIAINCEKTRTLNEIYSTLLKEADFEIELHSEKSENDNNEIKIGFKILSFIGINGGISTESKNTTQKKKLEFDINSVHDVIKALSSINFNKYLIIEDFHYLDEKVQEAFSFHLKIFNERSNLVFIILGVWPSEDRFSRFNGDLTGRLCNLSVDLWTSEDLLEVINKGEELLNIKISEGTKEILLESSFGSVAVLQMLCLELCRENGVNNTQDHPTELGKKVHITAILTKWIENQSSRYTNFLRKIIGNADTKSYHYRLIILCLIVVDAESLKKGIYLKEIYELIQKFQPIDKISLSDLENLLTNFKKIQIDNNILPFLFEYDDEKRVLHITDKFLFFWLANKNKFTSMMEVGIEEELVLRYRLNRY